jgi:DNA-binding NarL/FixJ family response regulator
VADKLKVVIADEHPILRLGVRKVLEDAGHQVLDEAADGQAAVDAAVRRSPDLAILEVTLPKLDGMEATRRILSKTKEKVQVVIYSAFASEEYVLGGLAAGARGYVTKSTEPRDFVEALRRVRHGDLYLSPDVSTPVVLRNLRHGRLDDPLAILTARERQVLRLVSEGLTNKEVASTLGVAVKTVEAHRANLMRKLDLHDLSALIRFSLRVGLLSPTR